MHASPIDGRPARRLALALLALAIGLALTGMSATPATALSSAATGTTPAERLRDPVELEGFLDGLVARQLVDGHIPGANLAVVKDSRLFFAKGYGYANLERRTPVVANQTLFRVGSIAKLFTWTAVMQLVEQGRLDLDADINSYLGEVIIPATYPVPITLAHLLTHTAGFEDRQLGITVSSPDDLVPLGSYLAGAMPARVFPPGTVTAYSNYGTTLAGYIVERVSGEPFAQYVQQHIFTPLGMGHSTFLQQLPPDLAGHVAVSYDVDDTGYHAMPFEYFQIAPAGGLSATATDMGQFMLAHLQDGRLGDARILRAMTAQDMHRRHFTNHPLVNGMTYGFVEMTLNGQRLLVHAGTTNDELFQSLLVLLPEQNMGLFVSYSGAGGGDAKWALLQAVLDRYYPVAMPAAPAPPADFAQRAGLFTGSYRSTRSAVTTIEKIQALFAPAISVSATPDGQLAIEGLSRGQTRWVEVAPLVFQQVDAQELIAFRADEQGRVVYLFQGNLPINAYRKLAWYEQLHVHYGLLAGCISLFLSGLVSWPIAWLVARRKGEPRPRLAVLARWLAWSVSALYVLSIILFVISLRNLALFPTPLTRTALSIALVATILTVGMVACAGLAWQRRYWSMPGRAHYTLLTLGALGFTWFLSVWNLLGFQW